MAVTITERDKNIFRFLSSGPANMLQIASHISRIEAKNGKTTPMDKLKNALRIRLHRLKQNKHINSRRYPNREASGYFSLYALTPYSLEILSAGGYIAEMVRMTLPDPYLVTHELAVTETVRTLKKESYEYGYELFFSDENRLKSKAKGGKKNAFYPDLTLRIRKKDLVKSIDIEIDNGTIPIDDIAKKVKDIKVPTIFLCMIEKRINIIRTGLITRKITNNPVCFTLLSDFCATGKGQPYGIFGTKFIGIKGDGTIFTWKPKQVNNG